MAIRILCAGKTDELFQTVKDSVADIECEVAKSTSVALALFLAQKSFPCLILSEPELTEGTPQELFAALKEEAQLDEIPFFVVATNGGGELSGELPSIKFTSAENLRNWLTPLLIEIPDTRPEETSE